MIYRFIGRYKDNATPDIVNRLVHSMVYPLLSSHIEQRRGTLEEEGCQHGSDRRGVVSL